MENHRFNPDVHHRRSIRLSGYDYARGGAYFVTAFSHGRECVFGSVTHGSVRLNDAGRMVERWWSKLNDKFRNVETDEFIVMPDHFHGTVLFHGALVGADPCVCPGITQGAHAGAPLHRIIQWFKTMTTNEYIRRIQSDGWSPFHNRLWQRNYYERIIRNEAEMRRIREYVQFNPPNWGRDEDNPNRPLTDPIPL